MSKRVLVTGITGYIGNHVGAELLASGHEVVGTVRSLAKAETAKAGIAKVAPVDKLSFVELDLTSDAGWDEAMQGIDFVQHVASPFVIAEPKDEAELIEPAVDGTLRVINAAKRAGVKRVVLTSSVVAVSYGRPDGTYGPDSWSDLNAPIGTYAKSKTLAEQAAWDAVKDSDLELTVINPGGVFGPTLSGRADGQSLTMMSEMLAGKMPAIPDIKLAMVDVRDVAKLHVAAMTSADAPGRRFIAATSQPVAFRDIAVTLKNAGYDKVSTRKAPTPLLKLVGKFNSEVRGMLPLIGKTIVLDNQATIDLLGWEPTPIETSVIDTAKSLVG